MRSNLPLVGACGIALVVASCRTSPSGAASATDVRSSEQPRVSESMERHDRRGIAIRDALVRGDLDLARREARSLAQLGARETLDPARLRDMSAAAERVAGASDLPSASHAFGALVKTCGDCHASSTALVAAYGAEPPEPGPGVPTRMTRHEWAANHLWFGLVVPSDGASPAQRCSRIRRSRRSCSRPGRARRPRSARSRAG